MDFYLTPTNKHELLKVHYPTLHTTTTTNMTAARPSTWLITGASSGIGKSLASEALKAGYKVIGTTRDVSKAEISCPDFSAKGGIWMGLDPAQKNAFDQFAKCSQEHDVDVLVNNAGYAFIGGVEDTRLVAFHAGVLVAP